MTLFQHQQLQQAIGLYERLLKAYDRLEAELPKMQAAAVRECMDDIGQLIAQIGSNSAELTPAAVSDGDEAATLIPRLQALVRKTSERNRAISQKGRAIMAVLADEMERTAENRNMTAGYSRKRQTTGGRIDIRSA